MFSLQRKPLPSSSEQEFWKWSLMAEGLGTSEQSVLGTGKGV